MKTTDRRKWLKTVGLTGGFALMGGLDALALSNTHTNFHLEDETAKLNSNENPYGPSKMVRQTLIDSFDKACRYPSIVLRELVLQLAEKEGVTKDHIVITGGSTEGLKAAGLTYGLDGGELIAADPTFQSMLRYAENYGGFVHRVPVNDKKGHDLEAMAKRVTGRTSLIFICNPNNPTGTLIEKGKLRDFCTSMDRKAMIFSDEAYYDYITEPDYPSMIELVKEGRNVIVSKTFSKVYGLAGLRIGYLVARPDISNRLKASVMAMTNTLAVEAAKTALKDDTFYKYSVAKNMEAKQMIYETLNDLNLEYIPSHTNFVFFKSGRHIDALSAAMEQEHVLIGRPFPPFYDWARISTGTLAQVEQFGKALKKVMG
ncbi:histidinol-phosphate aminotransferase family protein [Aggregatimonas sangjinii]|uniref:Histidinol-phosphate aminotransferase family protein n=1 Tax=Aggregatimonas sangjinii TaxID=2583587 RepID=A0A5B7SRW5_9FLAO|nr:histidinol-phosphate transaminase [Aggregatimonas sangjinii]QCX00089.1 histidinol-phosphate aminotransferase family protein [Aggregatimonas sangjinii]